MPTAQMLRIAGALAVIALVGMFPATAETTMLTLSCDGKFNMGGDHSEPVSNMGLVVDLTAGTVSGFSGVVAQINRIDAAGISFSGTGNVSTFKGVPQLQISVWGDIDRVTGAVSATTSSTASIYTYDLICKPARRLF